MTLELLDYDIIGNVDLRVLVRRRATFAADPSLPVPKDSEGRPTVAVDDQGIATRLVAPVGPIVPIVIKLEELEAVRAAVLVSARNVYEHAILEAAEDLYTAIASAPEALDARILAAEMARAQLSEMDKEIRAREAELRALDTAIAERSAKKEEG